MKLRNGRPASGITGFGVVRVSGLSRVPSPPARTSACIVTWRAGLAADALVGVAGAGQELAVEEVAPVHDERLGHALLDLALPVQLAELGPLGHEHDGVGPVDRLARRAADARPAEHVRRALAGDRVVDAHVRALALEPAGEHQAGGLSNVVGVWLEGHAEQRDLAPDERAEVLLELADGAPLLQLVDLDDGGEQLEVVAGVSCELL